MNLSDPPGPATAHGPAHVDHLLADGLDRRRVRAVLEQCFGTLSEESFDGLVADGEVIDLAGGSLLFAEGDSGDAMYVLLSGRLRALAVAADGSMRLLGEIEPGAPVGEMAVITGGARSASVIAMRDSSLLRIGADRVRQWFDRHPQLLLGTARQIVRRVTRSERRRRPREAVRNIALIPVTPGLDLAAFATQLCAGLEPMGSVLCIDATAVEALRSLPLTGNGTRPAPDDARRVAQWLAVCEEEHAFVVCCAEPRDSAWTRRCLRQADRVVLVADAAAAPEPGALERALSEELELHIGPANQLVLWHAPSTANPRDTAAWLAPRPAIGEHIHMRRGDAAHARRVARMVAGRAVGLVLGSGGARGIAHLGVYQALEEAGIPVDRVGGSSIGALIGGDIAHDLRAAQLIESMRPYMSVSPVNWRDLAIPPVQSLYRGERLRRMLADHVEPGTGIEDLWINFFCVSSNLSRAEESIQKRGPMARAVSASSAIPGLFPLVDIDGARHADGAFMNSLPADVMAALGAHRVIAVDLSDDLRPADATASRAPGIGESLVQSSLIASSARMAAQRRQADLLFNPDVRAFHLMRWSPRIYATLCRLGLEHARELLARTAEEDLYGSADG